MCGEERLLVVGDARVALGGFFLLVACCTKWRVPGQYNPRVDRWCMKSVHKTVLIWQHPKCSRAGSRRCPLSRVLPWCSEGAVLQEQDGRGHGGASACPSAASGRASPRAARTTGSGIRLELVWMALFAARRPLGFIPLGGHSGQKACKIVFTLNYAFSSRTLRGPWSVRCSTRSRAAWSMRLRQARRPGLAAGLGDEDQPGLFSRAARGDRVRALSWLPVCTLEAALQASGWLQEHPELADPDAIGRHLGAWAAPGTVAARGRPDRILARPASIPRWRGASASSRRAPAMPVCSPGAGREPSRATGSSLAALALRHAVVAFSCCMRLISCARMASSSTTASPLLVDRAQPQLRVQRLRAVARAGWQFSSVSALRW